MRAALRHRVTCGLLKKLEAPTAQSAGIPQAAVPPPGSRRLLLELASAAIPRHTRSLTLHSLIVMALAWLRGTWATVVMHFVFGDKACEWKANSALFSMIITEIAPVISLFGAARNRGLLS